MTVAEVKLWGRTIGAVSLDDGDYASFQYDPEFRRSAIEVSPLNMPLAVQTYRFPHLPTGKLPRPARHAGRRLARQVRQSPIDAWLATQGRTAESFNAVERLCYIGMRGMGALEFPRRSARPAHGRTARGRRPGRLASEVLTHRKGCKPRSPRRRAALREILHVGTSAGGARAKAVIAWNPATNEVRSGQIDAPATASTLAPQVRRRRG